MRTVQFPRQIKLGESETLKGVGKILLVKVFVCQ